MKLENGTNKLWTRVPVFGICIFIALYFVAAFYYPGGSQADKTGRSFSWLNNYWCDLLSEKAKNGNDNTARPVAIISWLVLCFSLSVFWYFLPLLFSISTTGKKIIRFCGITAMLIATFLFTSLHDVVIQVAGLLGFIAFIGTFIGLYKTRLYGFFYTGLFCLVLMCLNYIIMVGNTFTSYLPIIQKITFIVVLTWVLFINRKLISLSSGNIS
jgi:hypothetical protein